MGWRGAIRSLAAAARAAERDAQRRHREALKREMYAESSGAVSAWETYVSNLISVHIDLVDSVDWYALANSPKPPLPKRHSTHEVIAQKKLDSFKPGVFDFLLGGSAKRKTLLEKAASDARTRDEETFQEAIARYKDAISDWEADKNLGRRLIDHDPEAIREVIAEMHQFNRYDLIGSQLSFQITDQIVHVIPQVHSDEIIPNHRRKQLASGKLSETKMPIGQFNELYQDYVASVALKVGGDLFHILPLEEVYVTCLSELLNSQTGHKEFVPVLSVQFTRSTYMRLNLDSLDPSDSMRNFRHAMSFKKSKGFEAIDPLVPMS